MNRAVEIALRRKWPNSTPRVKGPEIPRSAYRIFLFVYIQAYSALSDRDRLILHAVEVMDLRYVVVAKLIEVRPEAVRMIVFRIRRRIFRRMDKIFSGQNGAQATTRRV